MVVSRIGTTPVSGQTSPKSKCSSTLFTTNDFICVGIDSELNPPATRNPTITAGVSIVRFYSHISRCQVFEGASPDEIPSND